MMNGVSSMRKATVETAPRARRGFANQLPLMALILAGQALAVQPLAAQEADGGREKAQAAVSEVLDALHQAASDADFDLYFSLYAREAVFLGTDATERWTREEFMEYAAPRFATGTGWTYHLLERHVGVAPGGETAWFDERLDNANLGETRGSGVLVMEDGGWKIAQYNLTIPVPNELARDLAQQIRALKG